MMKGWDFFYYSRRCRKQRLMAAAASFPPAVKLHRELAKAYADRAARAIAGLEVT
jgi:hypothetical protein